MSIHGFVQDGQSYLLFEDLMESEFVVAIGVSKVQNYTSISFYLDEGNLVKGAIKFIKHNNQYELHLCRSDYTWVGVPYKLPAEIIKSKVYVNLTDWLSDFSADILRGSYSFIEDNFDADLISETTTEIKSIKSLPQGIQLSGQIWTGAPIEYSIEYLINLYRLNPEPMVARVGDSRIGYFYEALPPDNRNVLSGQSLSMIHKFNLKRAPWKFIVHESIPLRYQSAVKVGILSWNAYFEHFGLGSPFQVLTSEDLTDPSTVDIFDMSAWYVLGTELNALNGPFSGFASSIIDYRSGENLFGFITLNLIKLASQPARYFIMSNLKDSITWTGHDINTILETYVSKYISWVVAHETGHQLGLRHNFMGNLQKDGYGSIMDYFDPFGNFSHLEGLKITGIKRDYDLLAIEYGYTPLTDERTGIKHPQLDMIANHQMISFGTDENYSENVNPLIGTTEDQPDLLNFIEQSIVRYQDYRDTLLQLVKTRDLTSYEYNSMFVYLYTFKYPELIMMALKFMGGRTYSTDRTHYLELTRQTILTSETILLKLMSAIQYSDEEYSYIIYDYSDSPNRQEFDKIRQSSIYAMGSKNLFNYYETLVVSIFRGLTETSHLIRLMQNIKSDFSASDLLFNFTFGFKLNSSNQLHQTMFEITEVDGIFPEIGAYLSGNQSWQDRLLNSRNFSLSNQFSEFASLREDLNSSIVYNTYQAYRQLQWIHHLKYIYHDFNYLIVREDIHLMFQNIRKIIKDAILPYLDTLSFKNSTPLPIWKHPVVKIKNHWELVLGALI